MPILKIIRILLNLLQLDKIYANIDISFFIKNSIIYPKLSQT